jgi:orotidine-5'-phosphate decarboxylase
VPPSSIQWPLAARVSVVATVGATRAPGGLMTSIQVAERGRHADQQELALTPGIGPRASTPPKWGTKSCGTQE